MRRASTHSTSMLSICDSDPYSWGERKTSLTILYGTGPINKWKKPTHWTQQSGNSCQLYALQCSYSFIGNKLASGSKEIMGHFGGSIARPRSLKSRHASECDAHILSSIPLTTRTQRTRRLSSGVSTSNKITTPPYMLKSQSSLYLRNPSFLYPSGRLCLKLFRSSKVPSAT